LEEILNDINNVVGVTGCFVSNSEGEVLVSTLPELYDNTILIAVSRIIAETLDGLIVARHHKVSDLDLVYNHGRFITKNIGSISLYILCTRNVNIPLLTLTANSAIRKLWSLYKQEHQLIPGIKET